MHRYNKEEKFTLLEKKFKEISKYGKKYYLDKKVREYARKDVLVSLHVAQCLLNEINLRGTSHIKNPSAYFTSLIAKKSTPSERKKIIGG